MLRIWNKQTATHSVLMLCMATLLLACGGGGGGGGLPELSVDSPSISEGDSGTSNLIFTATLSQTDAADVTVEYATTDDTASAGSDYTANNGTLTIPAGSSSATLTISINGDTDIESDEGFSLNLSNITSNASLVTTTATGTILNDDAAPVIPNLSIAPVSSNEGDSGTTDMMFAVSLDTAASADVTVDYTTADNTTANAAIAGSDYTANSGTLTIPTGSTTANITVSITGDTDIETDETFDLNLSNISSNATLSVASAVGTIINDDSNATPSTSSLNDTGVTTCSNATTNGLSCNNAADGTDQFPNQDAEHGRDVTDNDNSDGQAGFVFTKLDNTGTALADQNQDYATTPWSCMQDEVTGKMWEVKTDDNGLHDKDWTYSWYNSSGISDGGDAGVSNAGQCVDNRNCDTQKFIIAVNQAQLCGFSDWRLPTRHELISLMNFGASVAPYIDNNYFVNHAAASYWSGSPTNVLSVAYVNYSEFGAGSVSRFEDLAVRLVRGGN